MPMSNDIPFDPFEPETEAERVEAKDNTGAVIDDMCRRWAAWSRTRRFFGPPPIPPGILGKLTKKGALRGGPPDAALSAELSALNLAIAAQPDDVSRKVFELHYVHCVSDIKLAADTLGISRSTWYRYLADFRVRAYAAHQRILAENEAARAALLSNAEGEPSAR